jgi:O-Antigen ligase
VTSTASIPVLHPAGSRAQSHAAAFGTWTLVLLPAFAALLFTTHLSSAFLVPKSSLVIIAASVCAVCAFWNQTAEWRRLLREPLTLVLYAGFAWLCIVWLLSPLRYMGSSAFVLSVSGLLLFEVSRRLLSGSERRVIAVLSTTASLVSLVALAQFFFHFDLFAIFGERSAQPVRMRVFSTLGNPDFAGAFLAMCLPAICCIRRRALRLSLVVLVLSAIVCTGSRGSLLAAAVAIVVWFCAAGARSSPRRVIAAALIVCTMLFALYGISRWNGRSLGTAIEGRLTIWRVALHRIHPVGSGQGTFAYVYLPKVGEAMRDGVAVNPRFISLERHAQNDLVEIVVESGPIGAVLALLFLFLWTRTVWKSRGEYAPWALATLSAFTAAAMFDFPLHRGETVALLAIALALPLATAAPEEDRPTRPALRLVLTVICLAMIAVAVLPVMSSRLVRLGNYAESIEDFTKAANYYARAAKLWPENTDALFSATRAYARDENYSEALVWTETSKRYIAEPELWILRARILESMNENQRALNEMQSAQTLFPYSELPTSEIEMLRANEVH